MLKTMLRIVTGAATSFEAQDPMNPGVGDQEGATRQEVRRTQVTPPERPEPGERLVPLV